MTFTLFIVNDAPYGNERAYNALRLAGALAKAGNEEVRLFLIGDAASCAKGGQKVPQGYYSIEALLHGVTARGAEVGVCGTCMDARGLADTDLARDCLRGSMAELAAWTVWADKVVVF